MANKIYQVPETAIVWTDSGGDYVMTLQNLASGAGRHGAAWDRGISARPGKFAWRAWSPFATNPVVAEAVRWYAWTSDGTHPDNDDGTGDVAVSAEDKLRNLDILGFAKVDEAATGVEMVAHGIIEIGSRYFAPVCWNGTADNLQDTAGVSGFMLTPIPDEVQ